MNAEPPVIPTPASRRLAIFLKVACICLLIPFLLIPLSMTNGVLRERQGYQAQATEEIQGTWGKSQLITGPILVVPYSVTRKWTRDIKDVEGKIKTVEETSVNRGAAYILPVSLEVQADVTPEVRYRGIYEAVVYSAQVKLAGTISTNMTDIQVENAVYEWDKAWLQLGVSDARRLRTAPQLNLGGVGYSVESENAEIINLGLAARVNAGGPSRDLSFDMKLDLQGSGRLEFAPVGKRTEIRITSPWVNPSFTGTQLPVSRNVGDGGFDATWRMAHYGRGFPEAWIDARINTAATFKKILESGFGVTFAQPVNAYSMVERAQKYGVLFFVLVFAVFFLFEVTAALRIHPLQYAMVGAALALFFLGFLALSEFWSTGLAYGAAAAACTAMIAGYSWSFLKTGRRTLVIGGGLAATYGYLYFVLKSQDYALVAGTAALFAALALVMFCTRRINWYSLEMNTPAAAVPGDR